MKVKNWNKPAKSTRSSHSPLKKKSWLLIRNTWSSEGRKQYLSICIKKKKNQENSGMHLNNQKWLQVFLLDPSFGDIEFYYSSVDQSWYNDIKWIIVT